MNSASPTSPGKSLRRLLPGAAVTLLITFSACGGESSPPQVRRGNQEIWSWAWQTATESQREAMADGEITFDEYEAAALRAVQCITERGDMRAEALYDADTKTYQLAMRMDYPPGSVDRSYIEKKVAEADECYREHWNGINDAWSAQNQPSEQELAAARSAFASCLRESGLEVPDSPGPGDLEPFLGTEEYLACARRIQAEFGLPGFGG